jgi:hypothetical protein
MSHDHIKAVWLTGPEIRFLLRLVDESCSAQEAPPRAHRLRRELELAIPRPPMFREDAR